MTADSNPARMRIDFVSDVMCPWCAIGLSSLNQALANIGDDIQVDMHLQPFELNPQMPAEGEDASEHLMRKYGMPREQAQANQQRIRERGEELGFRFDMDKRKRMWNTFDAHRLLHWAGLEEGGKQLSLKQRLLKAYFSEGENVADHATLARLAGEAGLDTTRAAQVLAANEYADDVRQHEQFFQQAGINSVPAVIINQKHLISGGQPVEVFERALRDIASHPDGH